MWDEITHLFPNFNGCTVEVWKWVSNFITYITGHVAIYLCWDLIHVKGTPELILTMCKLDSLEILEWNSNQNTNFFILKDASTTSKNLATKFNFCVEILYENEPSTKVALQIRKSRDHVYWIWQYKVLFNLEGNNWQYKITEPLHNSDIVDKSLSWSFIPQNLKGIINHTGDSSRNITKVIMNNQWGTPLQDIQQGTHISYKYNSSLSINWKIERK